MRCLATQFCSSPYTTKCDSPCTPDTCWRKRTDNTKKIAGDFFCGAILGEFCLTEVHAVELGKFLVSWVMDMMCTEGHSLYRKGAGPQPQEDDGQRQGDKDEDPSRDEKADKKKKRASSPLSSESSAHQGRSQRKRTSKKKKAAEKLKRSSDESSNGSF